MILNYLILTLIIFSFFGYSIFFKKYLFYNKLNFNHIFIYDIFIGFSFIFIFAFIFNIILPLIYLTELFLLIGLIFLFYFRRKIKIDRDVPFFFLVLFAIIFINYNTSTIYDSNLYHIQILNWSSFYKIIFGLSNLEIRFGTNSFWQLILSIFNNPKYKVQVLYILNCVPISILISQFYSTSFENNKLSSIFIFSCLNFILLFSIIHPISNGFILNSIRSPEVDTVAMCFFIFSVYFFLKYFEDFRESDYIYCFLFSSLSAITKISHIGVMLLPFALFVLTKKKFNRTLFVCCILFILWSLKSFILSGCWVFPISSTCYPEFIWSTPINEIKLHSDTISSYPRAQSANPLRIMDFPYTLYSLEWFFPWIKTYFLATSFFVIFLSIIFISLAVFVLTYTQRSNKIYKEKIFYIFIVFYLINLYIWFKAPELRYGYGLFISLCCLSFSYSFKIFIDKFNLLKKFKFFPIILILILIIQNYKNINFLNETNKIKFDNSNIKFFKKIDDVEFYKSTVNRGFCNDFVSPCLIYPKKFSIKKQNNYKIIYRLE